MLTGLPVIVVGLQQQFSALEDDPQVVLLNTAPGEVNFEAMAGALSEAVELGAGTPLTTDQAAAWAVRAAQAIRLLGLTCNKVFDVSRAATTLIETLNDPRTIVQLAAAEALAVIRDAQAQQALVDLAIDTQAHPKDRKLLPDGRKSKAHREKDPGSRRGRSAQAQKYSGP